jgi:hypothetical protein
MMSNRRHFSQTLVVDDHLSFNPDHKSYLAQVRVFDGNQEITRVNMIPLLLDPESAGRDSPAQNAPQPQAAGAEFGRAFCGDDFPD